MLQVLTLVHVRVVLRFPCPEIGTACCCELIHIGVYSPYGIPSSLFENEGRGIHFLVGSPVAVVAFYEAVVGNGSPILLVETICHFDAIGGWAIVIGEKKD